MKSVKKFTSFFLLFSMLMYVLLTPFAHTANANEQETKNYTERVQTAIEKASNHILEKGVTSEWEAIGLVKAGKKVPSSYYEDYFVKNVDDQVINASRKKITDVERLVLSAGAIGIDATNVNGVNLVELIYNSVNWPNGNDSMIAQGNNGPIFALIALDSLSYDIPSDARWTQEKLMNYLVKNQNADGSWSLFGTTPNYDFTGMALTALGKYKQNSDVQEAIDKAVKFLSDNQDASGGYNDPFSGGVTSETTSQVIIGLTTAGIDPTSQIFTKENGNLLDHLLSFQSKDGGFKHLLDGSSNSMATEQALQALVAYQLFVKGEGPLYRFDKKETPPENPDNTKPPVGSDNQDKSNPPADNENKDGSKPPVKNENPSKQNPPVETKSQNNFNISDSTNEKGIEKGKKVEVKQGEKIKIQGSNVNLQLPNGLPNGTLLTVTDSSIKKYGGLKPAGDILDFAFEYPNGKAEEGKYILTFKVNSDVDMSNAGVYHYNEETGEWEYVPGEINAKERTITVKVDHFSSYGVFTHNENNGKPLPKTATDTYNLLLIGTVLFAIGASFLIYQWRRKQLVK